ncbi:MAG: beta-lactamase family protein [Myxococcales bacterium]|nr:beta-lactamase family protein [Myxococcales bacterium]
MIRKGFAQGPVQGEVAPGFESVRNVYERETQTMAELNTQLCVYHKGQKVVDLWRSAAVDSAFSADSLVNVFSSGKSLETIAIASLVDRGLLDYGDRIAQHWPEFTGGGKDDLTVADLMRHEAGMAAFNVSLAPADLLRENIKKNNVGAVVEGHEARFPARQGNRREYHAITRGWIANELYRRVDPAGRTMGEYLRDDVSRPLGADAMIGVESEDLSRVSEVVMPSLWRQILETLKPRALGRRIKLGFLQLLGRFLRILWSGGGSTIRKAPPPFSSSGAIGDYFNDPVVTAGETPSAGAKCSARGLARIAAMMSARGHWDGKDYLGRDAWEALHAHPLEADMAFAPTDFTQGGVHRFGLTARGNTDLGRALNAGREGFYGWMGFGGSIFQWNPDHQIGFAFVPTSLHAIDLCNERGKVYQAEVLRCVKALSA